MKSHIYILTLGLSFCTGMVYLVPALIVYIKRGASFKYYYNYRYFFPYFFVFTIMLFSYSMYSYSVHNIADISPAALMTMVIVGIIALHMFLVLLPAFIHAFFEVPFGKKANFVFFSLALISLSANMTLLIVFPIRDMSSYKFLLHHYSQYVFSVVFIVAAVYSLIIAMVYRRHLMDDFLKKMARTYIVFSVIVFSGVFLEFVLPREVSTFDSSITQSIVVPLMYLVWSLVAIYYSVRYYLFIPDEMLAEGPSAVVLPDFVSKYNLTERENEIVELIVKGFSNAEISEELSISLPTVKTHVSNVFQKAGARNRTELMSIIIHDS